MDIFDILGPVMVGPLQLHRRSSPHRQDGPYTAGR